MKNLLIAALVVMVSIYCFEMIGNAAESGQKFSKNLDQYHFCHRCGMAVEKTEEVITVTNVPEGPWYQCCPMCALMDIIESGKGRGTISANGEISSAKIEIVIQNHGIRKIEPESAILLVGGSCLKNKIFDSNRHASEFIAKNKWAKVDMLKPVSKTFAMLKDKKKAIDRCAMCANPLAGHEKTTFTIITKDKKRRLACCGHCGLFMLYKMKDKAKRAVTSDFKTGRLIDAKHAFYVVANDHVVCCYPSTISFENDEEALRFQKQHGGEIMAFQEAMVNMDKVMKK